MLDDHSSDDEYTPSSFSEGNNADVEHLTVFRSHKSAQSPRRSHGIRAYHSRHLPKSNSAPPQDIFNLTKTGPITIFNKRRRRKEDLKRTSDDISDSTSNVKPWLAYSVLGGLRQDPFNALPVEPRDCIPQAVDHFVQAFIPERILRPFGAVPGIENLAHDYFQLVINDVCVFEATVAQSQASYVAQQGIRRPTKEVLHHHGKALIHLQEKLSDPILSMQDATIHAILAIMGTHFFFGELDAHQSHLDGLWSLIKMRGGIETLGWSGTLRQAVETVTSFVAYTAKHETPAPSPDLSVDKPARTSNDLDYPKHPFSPDLCETIAKLPDGFSELALKRNFSVQTINLVVDLYEQQQRQQSSFAHNNANSLRPPQHHIYAADKLYYYLHTHHISSRMPELERMICIGLLAYTVSSSSWSSPPSNRTHVYDEALQQLLGDFAQYTFFNYEQESLLWVTFCFAGLEEHLFGNGKSTESSLSAEDQAQMMDTDDESVHQLQGEPSKTQGQQGEGAKHFLHHTILRFKQSKRWASIEAVVKKFLWTQERLEEWKEKWEECVMMHRPQGKVQSRETTPGTSVSGPVSVRETGSRSSDDRGSVGRSSHSHMKSRGSIGKMSAESSTRWKSQSPG